LILVASASLQYYFSFKELEDIKTTMYFLKPTQAYTINIISFSNLKISLKFW